MNRTIVEKARCMLIDSNLKREFWAEAVVAAVDIINTLPNSGNNNKSPDELWYGKKCDISIFKAFGCKALMHVPNQKRKKWDNKATECIYLRYASDAKAYRLYDIAKQRIVNSRDVVFFENESARSMTNKTVHCKIFLLS